MGSLNSLLVNFNTLLSWNSSKIEISIPDNWFNLPSMMRFGLVKSKMVISESPSRIRWLAFIDKANLVARRAAFASPTFTSVEISFKELATIA